ncbi:hypothetical protein BC628DRAFT_1501694 [Trametes gibbosa]|nr:hypothetical protein BC628DRAFT_1501694 [Trametes gibbosa]
MIDIAIALGVAALVVGLPPLVDIARRCLSRLLRGPAGDLRALQKRVLEAQVAIDNLLAALKCDDALPGLDDAQKSIEALKGRLCVLQAQVDHWCSGKTWPRIAYLAFWDSEVKALSSLIHDFNGELDAIQKQRHTALASSNVPWAQPQPRKDRHKRRIVGALPDQWFRLPVLAPNPYRRLRAA